MKLLFALKKFLFVLCLVTFFVSCKQELKNSKISGSVFGTFYEITYASNTNENYKKQFDSIFYIINKSMSNYQPDSNISKLNKNENISVDAHFVKVFKASKKLYRETEGALDPTIGNLVNAWDFGSEKPKIKIDSIKIDSLLNYVGFNRVGLVDNYIKKEDGVFIDFNAIAKGYAVDVIGEFLEAKAVKNYMVNIGGELRSKGVNVDKKKNWTVGVENPNFDGSQSTNTVIELKDKAMATSGTYRKFKLDENGNRYAHIINTKTGYPSKTNILSVSVIAETCMMADGYATALQAMGVKKADYFLAKHPELKAYIIFENNKQELEVLDVNGFKE